MRNGQINRREAVRGVGIVGATVVAAAACPAILRGYGSADQRFSVTVLLDEPIGTIRPAIYSQFAEHIGGVIYDGIWVGPDSKVANIDGIRRR